MAKTKRSAALDPSRPPWAAAGTPESDGVGLKQPAIWKTAAHGFDPATMTSFSATSPDCREFVVESAASRSATSFRQLAPAFVGCTGFTALGILLFAASPSIEAKVTALASIAVFGGGGLLAFLIAAFRPVLGMVCSLRVDAGGITTIAGAKALTHLGLGVARISIPWSNVAGLSVVDTGSVPILARSKKQLPFEFVGVRPKDFEASVRELPKFRTLLSRKIFEQAGVIVAGPVAGLSAYELLGVLETYRNRAS